MKFEQLFKQYITESIKLQDDIKESNEQLPPEFDLHYDIKTRTQLKERLKQLREELEHLEEMMKNRNIKV